MKRSEKKYKINLTLEQKQNRAAITVSVCNLYRTL